jgi:hypothetical protein
VNSDLRRRLLEKHGASEQADNDSNAVLAGDEYDSALRIVELATARSLDPRAGLAEELTLRLLGQGAGGGFDLDWQDVLDGLRKTVDALSGGGMELVGLSPGSTILHLRPTIGADRRETIDDGVPLDGSQAEAAAMDLVRLLSAAEGKSDIRQWSGAANAFDAFVDALDRHDLNADVTWWASSGRVSSARLTSTGREYVKALRKTKPTEGMTLVVGRLTELKVRGVVKVKTGVATNSPAYEVIFDDSNSLLGMHLELGQTVRWVLRVHREEDRLGRTANEKYYYIGPSAESEPFPGLG